MSKQVIYLAHPVFEAKPDGSPDAEAIEANLTNARAWLRWFFKHTSHAIAIPWMPYVQALGEDNGADRERGLADDCAMVARCDALILVGGRVSNGMTRERTAAMAAGVNIVNLTMLKREPPEPGTDDEKILISLLQAVHLIPAD